MAVSWRSCCSKTFNEASLAESRPSLVSLSAKFARIGIFDQHTCHKHLKLGGGAADHDDTCLTARGVFNADDSRLVETSTHYNILFTDDSWDETKATWTLRATPTKIELIALRRQLASAARIIANRHEAVDCCVLEQFIS